MLDVVSKDDVVEITQALVASAKKGDVQAAKIVMSYSVGKPDRVNIEEWDIPMTFSSFAHRPRDP